MSLLLALTGSVAPPAPPPAVVSLGGAGFDVEGEIQAQEEWRLFVHMALIAIAAAGGFDG